MPDNLKEFLYVDVDRTRSLLAQLQGGVVEEVKSHRAHTAEGGVSAKVFGVGGRGDYGYESGTEESRSLQDLTFIVFEELADEEGWISDLDPRCFDPRAWESGEVHESLVPGQVIRLACDLQLLDGGLFRQRMERFEVMAEAIVKLNPPDTSGMSSNKRKEALRKAREDFMGDLSKDQLEAIAGFVEAFQGDSIALRALPCGESHLEYSFTGSLLGRQEYIQREREHLFSRYGTQPKGWTAVLQVAAVPDRNAREQEYDAGAIGDVADGDLISRSVFERMASGLLTELERVGIMEGPRWPSVSVTPLGVYRPVAR